MDLFEIAQREECILFDTSIYLATNYVKRILNKRAYHEIRSDHLKKAQESTLKLIDFLNTRHTKKKITPYYSTENKTELSFSGIPELRTEQRSCEQTLCDSAEWSDFCDIKQNRVRELKTIEQVEKEFHRLKNKIEENAKYFNLDLGKGKLKNISKKNKIEFYKLFDNINLLIKEVSGVVLDSKLMQAPIYDIIYSSVLKVSMNYPDFCEKNPSIYQQLGIELKTDQNVIATLFYLAMESHNSYALITRDWGMFKLAEKFHKFVYLDNSDISRCFCELLRENPVKIYIPNPPESFNYYMKLSSDRLDEEKKSEWNEKKELDSLKKKGFDLIKF